MNNKLTDSCASNSVKFDIQRHCIIVFRNAIFVSLSEPQSTNFLAF